MDGTNEADPAVRSSGDANRGLEKRAFIQRRLDAARQQKPQAPTIPRQVRGRPMPLSFAQQRIWFLQELAPGNPFYNIAAAVPLNGPIAIDALEAALNAIVKRHESLRTVYRRVDGEPRQIVLPHRHAPLDVLDLGTGGRAEAERQLDPVATREAETPFDLSAGPMIRFRLVRLASTHHMLLLTVHHIAADGWSMSILFRELSELYEANKTGRAADLPELQIQYVDFAHWQRSQLTGATLEKLLDFWRAHLSGAQDLPLITDRPRPHVASFRGDFLDVKIDRQTQQTARKLARDHECTLFQTILAAFKAVLARFANTTDVVVGAPIANRVHPGLEPLIGFFVNSIALRTDLNGDPTFAQVLSRVRQGTLGAYAHQDLPFERLVEELRPERDLSRNPLFQVSFQIQNSPGISDQPVTDGQDFRRIERSSAILDLALSLWETPDGLVGGIEYSTDLFDRASVKAIADALVIVVRAAAADPEIRLSALPLMDAQAGYRYARLLEGKGAPARPSTMTELFSATANRQAERTALVDAGGSLSFADLDLLSGRLAKAFHGAGIRQGNVVGLALDRDRHFVACMLAAVKLGAAYLPMDPDSPPGRLKSMAAKASPAIVITNHDAPSYPHGPGGRIGDLLDFAATCDPFDGTVVVAPDDPCYVLFTSGSTGQPKAVEVSHAALANHMHWMCRTFAVTPQDRILQRTPTHFDASIWEFWLPLVSGARLCLPPAFHAADARSLQAAMDDLEPTILQCVPSLLPQLLSAKELDRKTSSVRILCCGGEPLSAQLARKAQSTFGSAQIVNLYGPTEATIDATWHLLAPTDTDPVPIGKPIDHCRILIVDETGELCPPNMRGEIAIGGRPLARGYLGQADLTADRFVSLPGRQGRYFLTGDIGWYRADGTLYCAGRKDRQVKLRGNRIELGEIEAVLRDHDIVEQAAVFVHRERSDTSLAAFVTVRDSPYSDAMRQDIEERTVDEWEGLYRVVYAEDEAPRADLGDDFTGWNRSVDGRPIPRDEMMRWADETAARIAALKPRGIFEIGCGSGLLLTRLAPHCARYVGCDLSAPVIARLRDKIAGQPLGAVSLHVAKAQDAAEIEIDGCDTILLNSVVQYLPSAAHLTEVLLRNAGRMPEGARVFIGDVRPMGLLQAFHAEAETARAASDLAVEELHRRVAAACAQEKELLFDPDFFRQLGDAAPVLKGDVEIRLKRGADDNELTAYRYDVSIRLGAPRPAAPLDWQTRWRGAFDLSAIERAIEHYDHPVAVSDIPNRRVARAVALSHLIQDREAGMTPTALVAEAETLAPESADPGRIAALAQRNGLKAEVLPNRQHPDRFDLVLHDGSLDAFSIDAAQPGKGSCGRALSTEPTLRALTARLAPELREHLADYLPAVMCPARLSVLDRMPMLPNGKLDYRALADHLPHEPVRGAQFEAPGDALEQLVAEIFADVLGVTQVGAGDDFFAALGGHSLLATRAIARLREFFGDAVPLRLLFEHPTPSSLATQLSRDNPDAWGIAEQYVAMQDLDEASLDALLANSESAEDE